MSKFKFEIGERVRVNIPQGEDIFKSPGYGDSMSKLKGTIAKVYSRRVEGGGVFVNEYNTYKLHGLVNASGLTYKWHEDWLQKVEANPIRAKDFLDKINERKK